ncbi:hypothetical protein CHUAL_010122 [Chamberlinius hualienensis]
MKHLILIWSALILIGCFIQKSNAFSEQIDHVEHSLEDSLEDSKHQERSIDYLVTRGHDSYKVVDTKRVRACDVYLWQGEGNLTSYDYPFNYPDSIDCVYRIPRIDSACCALELYFHDFDLETDGVGCDRDYFMVGSRRYCGRVRPGTAEYVEFPYGTNELALKFKSNGAESGRGFCIQVKRNYKSCSQKLVEVVPNLSVKTVQGRLTSYGYPEFYRSNINCTYFIIKEPGFCSVELEFVDFDVEEGVYSENYLYKNCQKDSFLMEGRKYCGNTLDGKKVVIEFGQNKEIPLIFVSQDSRGSHRGFDIRYNQLPCSTPAPPPPVLVPLIVSPEPKPTCHYEYSSWDITIQSANFLYGSYPVNHDCMYIIKRASNDVCELEVTFSKFDLEYDRLCRGDYLEVNGGKLCGPLPDGTTRRLKFYGSEIVLKFHSDDTVAGAGFSIRVQQKSDCSSAALTKFVPVGKHYYCDEVRSAQEFYIQSLRYPYYQSNYIDCAYIIRPFSPSVCELHLTFLSFDLQDDTSCTYDYLEIDGQKYCGNAHHGSIKKIKFNKPEILIRFHSERALEGRGFQIFAQQRRDCDATTTTQLIVKPVVDLISVSTPPACDAVFTSGNFQIRSLNYPGNYFDDMCCTLRIQRLSTDVCHLQLLFNSFDLEVDEGCRYDYLDIGGQRLCGNVRGGTITTFPFDSPEMVLRFKSDHTNTRRGFDISMKQIVNCKPTDVVVSIPRPIIVETKLPIAVPVNYPVTVAVPITGCDQVFTTWEFYFQSIYYPLNYGTNVDCTYRALKFSPSVCEVELHFISFDTEFHPDCAKDFLEAEGERFCGTIAPGSIRRYKFDKPEFVMRFRSDHETSGVGFNILVRQKTSCPTADPPNVVPTTITQNIVLVPPKIDTYVSSNVIHTPVRVIRPTLVSPIYDIYLTQSSSQLTSLNYPIIYSMGINCTYRISRSKGVCAIELYFNDFDIEVSPDCRNDYLKFGGRRYCGNELKGQTRMLYFEHSSEAVLNFVSDKSGVNGKGWWAFYRQVLCSDISASFVDTLPDMCDHDFNQEFGYIKSLNYPLSAYPSNEDCYYRLQRTRDDICSVELIFTDFRLESSTGCNNDYLEINRQRYCGSDLLHKTVYINFPVGSNEILLHFKSNDIHADQGFFIQARQLSYGCSRSLELPAAVPLQYLTLTTEKRCQSIIRAQMATIESPGYPSSYSPNSVCTYIIERFNSDVCGLQLDVVHFSLETSRLCQYDYLQSPTGDRMCGNSWTGVKRTVPFPRHEQRLIFVFHSDGRNEDQGFSINVHQIITGCP